MSDLRRIVRRLVEVLEASSPSGVHRPIAIGELRETLMPYRTNRTTLGLSSSEDYDLLLLRLLSEEGGYVRAYPPEAAEKARDAVAHPNPDLSLVETLGDATVQIGAATLSRVRVEETTVGASPPSIPEQEPVPPPVDADQAPAVATLPAPVEAPPAPAAPVLASTCRSCKGALPTHREVVFCPFCGERVKPLLCSQCGSELEAGWRHCVTCGQAL